MQTGERAGAGLKIDANRLLSDLQRLRQMTDTAGNGVTRFSYSAQDDLARAYIREIARQYGMDYEQDGVGNIRISHPANIRGRKTIVTGSHIDTVQNGGWLDGIFGVMSALEAMRTMIDNQVVPGKNFAVVAFAEEEGSNFGSTLTGSKFATGVYTKNSLKTLARADGKSLETLLSEHGYSGDLTDVVWDMETLDGFLELHIEQGPVLEQMRLPVGIVTSIYGMRVIDVEINGIGNHAGASPMAGRKDALAASAECILAVEKIAADKKNGTVATVGRIGASPNASNVIPGCARFSVEVRHSEDGTINGVMDQIIRAIETICGERGVYCSVQEVAFNSGIRLDGRMVNMLQGIAEEKGVAYTLMGSGAVHDASMLAPRVPTGMIFVPSIGGRSHVPQEDTSTADLICGAQLLFDAVLHLTA